MHGTADKSLAERRHPDQQTAPTWSELLKRIGGSRPEPREAAPRGRAWRDIAADVIIGRR